MSKGRSVGRKKSTVNENGVFLRVGGERMAKGRECERKKMEFGLGTSSIGDNVENWVWQLVTSAMLLKKLVKGLGMLVKKVAESLVE